MVSLISSLIIISVRDYGSCLSPLHLVIPTPFLNAFMEKIYVHSLSKNHGLASFGALAKNFEERFNSENVRFDGIV